MMGYPYVDCKGGPGTTEPACGACVTCLLRAIDDLNGKLEESSAENTRLRAALSHSKSPCIYCSLPADEWSKCKQGFPGCGRMDDAMGCPELGASFAMSEVKRLADALVVAGDDLNAGVDGVLSATDVLKLKTNWHKAKEAFTNPI